MEKRRQGALLRRGRRLPRRRAAGRQRPELQPGAPQNLFQTGLTALGGGGGLFGVSPDGQRFLLRLADERDRPASIIVLANWPAALNRKAR